MPWDIKRRDGEYCVIKREDGEVEGCHETRADAVDQLRALHAAETEAAIADSYRTEKEEIQEFADDEDLILAHWAGNIAFENVPTGDNREFQTSAITWNEEALPLPFLHQYQSSDGHSGSFVIGRVDEISKDDNGVVHARGIILDTPEGRRYHDLIKNGAAGGVSIDGDSAEYSVEELDNGKHKVLFSSIRIRGLTAVSVPAFADAKVSLLTSEEFAMCERRDKNGKCVKKRKRKWNYAEDGTLTAAAAPLAPPSRWFQNQFLPGPTPQTVTKEGHVFGHLALFGTCHIGMPSCTKPPQGGTYAYFHTGVVETAEGEDVAVGHLTFDTGHASVQANARAAAEHYDHTGTVAADVVVGEDEFGIWFSGALRPHLTDEQIRAFKAAPLSGDWRRIGNKMELVAALSVNVPGFPVPRQRTKVLTASGQDQTFISTLVDTDYDTIGRETYKEDLASRIKRFDSSPKE